jgi:hypothetical protein
MNIFNDKDRLYWLASFLIDKELERMSEIDFIKMIKKEFGNDISNEEFRLLGFEDTDINEADKEEEENE